MQLVTGAAGLSGTLVVEEFVRQNIPVRAMVRSRGRAAHLAGLPGVELIEGDFLQPDTLERALDGVDRAVLISSSNAQMVDMQCGFIDAARRAGTALVVKFSGWESNVGFDMDNFVFTRMHRTIERYLEGSGVAWTHLQPSQFMQVYLREAPAIIARQALFLPMADGTLAPVDVADVAKAIVAILTSEGHAGKAYPMTGPEALTMSDVAAHISAAIGTTIDYVNVTPEERHAALVRAGVPVAAADALDEQTRERLAHPVAGLALEAHRSFGLEPTTFADFAKRNAHAFTKRP